MKTNDWTMLFASVCSAAIVSAVTGMFVTPAAAVVPQSASGAAVASLEQQLADLTREQQALEARLGRLQNAANNRSEVGGIDAAVERWIAANAPELRTATPAETAATLDVDDLLTSIVSRKYGKDGPRAFWLKLGKSGQTDAVLAAMEKLAEASPHDAKVQQALAETYVAKTYEIGMGPQRIAVSRQADAAFDRALAVDETLWGARFGKAIELSRLPSMLGKQTEAITQFEILVGQQEQRSPESRYAQTYFFLGNLYQESGKPQKAAAAWRRGLEFFPANSQLRGQIEAGGTNR